MKAFVGCLATMLISNACELRHDSRLNRLSLPRREVERLLLAGQARDGGADLCSVAGISGFPCHEPDSQTRLTAFLREQRLQSEIPLNSLPPCTPCSALRGAHRPHGPLSSLVLRPTCLRDATITVGLGFKRGCRDPRPRRSYPSCCREWRCPVLCPLRRSRRWQTTVSADVQFVRCFGFHVHSLFAGRVVGIRMRRSRDPCPPPRGAHRRAP